MDAFAWALVLGTFAMVFLTALGIMALLLPLAAARCDCSNCRQPVDHP